MMPSISAKGTFELPLRNFFLALQDFTVLSGQAVLHIFKKPHSWEETLEQMDYIGVRSLPIVTATALFVGMTLTVQVTSELAVFGAKIYLGRVTSPTIVRELGPVITSIMVAGRAVAGMAAELGSMTVTYQIDAMRAMGTDPVKKLVTPRVVAATIVLPILTVIDDAVAIWGGDLVAVYFAKLRSSFFIATAMQKLTITDIIGGLVRPTVFGFLIATVGCSYGLRTRGGAKGVRTATTKAVVTTFVLIFFFDFLIAKFMVTFFPPS